MTATWENLTVDGGEMRAYMALPERDIPAPGVVVAQHAGGVDAFIQGIVKRFAGAGFAAIAPDLYHRDDPGSPDDAMTRMSRLQDSQIVRDMTAAKEHLRSQAAARADSIGVTGFCMGGRVAYLMAVSDPGYKAAVVFYGGNIFVPWGEGRAPIAGTSRIACTVLGLFGEDDGNPSPEDVRRLDAELTKHGKVHEFHSYAGAGHAFMTEGRPSYRAEAAKDAWEKTLVWFRRYLV